MLLPGRLSGHRVTLAVLTRPLSQILGRPVVDKTGVSAAFELVLEWASDTVLPDTNLPSIFTAVQEQLGLKLEATKQSTEILVIDRAEKPSND